MSDWFKKISSLICAPQDSVTTPFDTVQINHSLIKTNKLPDTAFNKGKLPRRDPTFAMRETSKQTTITSKTVHNTSTLVNPMTEDEHKTPAKEPSEDGNIKALKHLRSLPRGTQVDSRIAAIRELLGAGEIFKTLKMLRWPQGVVCPRCHSANVVRRDPPNDAVDQRHFYVCLNCKGEGSPSDFDDFTGLPIGEMHALRQWILCWYLIGFCSVAQIAKVLGISIQEVMQIAQLGNELTVLPDDKSALQAKEQLKERNLQDNKKQRMNLDHDADLTHSASKSPLKPGYKSKK